MSREMPTQTIFANMYFSMKCKQCIEYLIENSFSYLQLMYSSIVLCQNNENKTRVIDYGNENLPPHSEET